MFKVDITSHWLWISDILQIVPCTALMILSHGSLHFLVYHA